MKVYRQLVRTFIGAAETDMPAGKRQKLFYAVMGVVAVCFIMVPCCLLIGYLSYGLTLGLNTESADGTMFIVHFIALFSMVFGIHVILNVFYFSGDNAYILPLPISPGKVIAAKFTAALVNESVMQWIVLFSAVIGFFLGVDHGRYMFPAAMLGALVLPVAPLAYCGILCVLMMAGTKWIRNKTHARRLSFLVSLIMIVVAVALVGMLKDMDMMRFTEQLKQGGISFYHAMNILFPTNYLYGKMLSGKSLPYFFLYLLLNAAILLVFYLLAQKLYYRGLLGLGSEGSTKTKRSFTLRKTKQHSPAAAYFKKECLVLFHTPAYLMNCIFVNFLWPILAYAVYLMQADSSVFQNFFISYRLENELACWIVTLLVLVGTVLLTAANSIAASAITREGKHYDTMKYWPISYRTQLHIKAAVSIMISSVFVEGYLWIFAKTMKMPQAELLYDMLVCLLEVCVISYLGVFLDTINPKLIWDDELNALRGNYNIFFNMAYAMLLSALFTGVMALAYFATKLSLWQMRGLLLLALVVGVVWMERICIKKGEKNLEAL